jgi:uncharacterized protein YjeT (DUF2065 family)
MRDFAAAIGLVFALEGLLMAGFTDSMRKRMAAAAREDATKLRKPRRGAYRRRDRLGLTLAAAIATGRRRRASPKLSVTTSRRTR